ncbi:uncharacterized protein PAC_13639 [Phialocephala subalpina]|uniref:ER membrane protein complex subunit 1 n=1 Tax=Phialocephala subalpina TaxID=576137 RepID=A0A1L7XFD9_9HELO|nr:uncharacterized protein PAC_13639 [Phialocephala subalpina]
MRLPLTVITLALSLLPSTHAVFADEAYTVDYHHELLGLPLPQTTFFHRPRKDDKATLLYTLSDLGVLGAVHPGTGRVVWRQLLAGESANNGTEKGFLRPVEGESTVVSAIGGRVDSWDAMSGRERWGNVFSGTVKDLEVMETPSGDAKDVLALFEEDGKSVLRLLKGKSGNVKWEYRDEAIDLPLQVSTNVEKLFVTALHGSKGAYNIKVTQVDPVTGKKGSEYTLRSLSEIHGPEDVLLVGANSASPIIAWTDKDFKNLKINVLGRSAAIVTLPLKEADGPITEVEIHAPHLIQSLPHFLVHSYSATANRADVYHVNLASGSVEKEYELPKLPGKGAVSVSSQDANVYFTRLTEDECIVVSSASHGILGRWPMKFTGKDGALIHGASEVVKRTGDAYAVRTAVVTSNDDWLLVRNGAVDWTRSEGLSGAVAAAWADIPESESLAKTLEAEAHINPLSAYIHRVNRHAHDLQYLPAYLQTLPKRLLSSIIGSDAASQTNGVLVRDNFGFNKLVIVATERGRVYGLDAGNQGTILWSTRSSKVFDFPASEKWDVKGIYVDPSKGTATIRGSRGEFVIVHVLTGNVLGTATPGSHPSVRSAVVVDTPSGTRFLPIGLDGNPGEIPSTRAPKDSLVTQGKAGEIKGLKYETSGDIAAPVTLWTFQPGPGEKIINVVSRPTHDPVASIGKVLGDRTVLYKYLNQNVVLVTAVAEESSSVIFYLIDSVSGDVLYSATHEGVDIKQPITSVLTENWFAYSLWSDIAVTSATSAALPASKGYQIVISELFESSIPNDRGPLGPTDNSSSIEPSDEINGEPALPYVITQSFLIPESISHMSVSQTSQGITSRQLICTLAGSNAVVGIPRHILDARRPVGRAPTPAEMEESLVQYHPVIDFDPRMTLTHKREVIGIKDVIATPAILESTSLLFAYGIDIFGTRVAPSAAFDILGKSFNRLSLVATVLALWVGVFILAPMTKRKQINERWAAQ